MPHKVKIGLDALEKTWPKALHNARAGLLVHPASVNSRLTHAVALLSQSRKFSLRALFGPQHGIWGETQDNMIEWEGFMERTLKIPVYSLYGKTRTPTSSMLKDIDVMVIDLQDVGARYYTFIWTMAHVMQACHDQGISVVLLDRPNPIGGHIIEGPVLDPDYASFVGLHQLPVRHGMTIGEIGLYIKDFFYPRLSLHIIPMRGWKRKMWFDKTLLPWVFPSPNIPTLDTVTVYAGMCLLEGTNLSEGRGTTRPFEIFGAPFIDPDTMANRLRDFKLPGVIFRPMSFSPTFQKHAGKLCGGAQVHLTNREKFKPFRTAVTILKSACELYPKNFAWKKPPYEYEESLLPIDILAGTDRLRKDLESGKTIRFMEAWWDSDCREFDKNVRSNYLLYR